MVDLDVLLAWGAAYKKIKSGEIIFQEGNICCFYYELIEGKVRWANISIDGRECIHSMVEPGESFGELPLFDNGVYAASAVAEEDSLLIRLNKPSFLQLLRENNDINFSFMKMVTKRMRFAFSLLNAYGTHFPQNRIAALINNLKTENKNISDRNNQLLLTRKQIAEMTGLRIETVIRTMRHMHDNGYLTICKGKVYCDNMIQLITA